MAFVAFTVSACGGSTAAPISAGRPLQRHACGGRALHRGRPRALCLSLREHRLRDSAHTALLLGGKVATTFQGAQYAYGFVDRVVGGRRFVGHSRGARGMNGELAFEPNGGYIIVVLSNFDPPAAGQVANFILERLPQR